MAVRLVRSIEFYIGLTTDTKPTGVEPGSVFIEVNAGTLAVKKYITPNDGTNWYETTLPLY